MTNPASPSSARGRVSPGRAAARSLPVPTVAIVLLLLAAGCGDSTGPDTPDDVLYSQHVQPALEAGCSTSSCHRPPVPAAGLDLTSYESIAAGSDFGSAVVPFRPGRSPLYLEAAGLISAEAPHVAGRLGSNALELVRRWIEEGACNDDGRPMYSDVVSKVFVACQGENAVAVLDSDPGVAERGLVVRLLDVVAPHSVYVDPSTRRLYVSRFETASDNIHVYDADTYERVATGRAGTFPALMWITPDGSQLWVTNFDAGGNPDHRVRVLDPRSPTLQQIAAFDIPGVEQPHGLAMTADGSRVFTANILTSNISVFSTNLGTNQPDILWPSIPLPGGDGQQPQQCVLSADESHLFVSALLSNRVHVLDLRGMDQLGWVPTWSSVDVGEGPWILALSPSGAELWVANWVGESVSVLDVSNPDSPVVVATLQPADPRHPAHPALRQPVGIAFSPDGNRVYVASTNGSDTQSGHHPAPEGQKNPGNVVIFDAQTRQILAVADVPNFARFVTFLP